MFSEQLIFYTLNESKLPQQFTSIAQFIHQFKLMESEKLTE